MNNFSHQLINFLDSIQLSCEKYRELKPMYDIFVEKYKNIKLEKVLIESKKTKLTPSIDIKSSIIKYLSRDTQSLGLSKKNKDFIKGYDAKNISYNTDWLNIHGKELNRLTFNMINNNLLPDRILKHIVDRNLYGEFTSLDVLNEIESSIRGNKTLGVKYDGISALISINYKKLTARDLDIIVKRALILSIVHNINIPIKLNLWLTGKKKLLPNNYKILGPKEINSGVTMFSDRTSSILRKEEYGKLILHELIHFLDIDFKRFNDYDFSKHFNINPNMEIRLFESYTELCACIVNTILCSYEYNNRKNYNLFVKFLCYEIKFSIFQIAKILLFFGFKDINDFVKPYDGLNRFKQDTSVFSYFFIKGALLFSISKTNNFFSNHCEIMKFKSNSYKEYLNLVLECSVDRKYLYEIQKMMIYIKNNKINKKIMSTLRMTCVEVE